MKNRKIIVTGCNGFIGFHVTKHLLENDYIVAGIDNQDNYYNVSLKRKRLSILSKFKSFNFYKKNIIDKNLKNLLKKINPGVIINLAAQPGVRYSFINPQKYIDTNIKGFLNILESMKENGIKKLIYASSSSVYGNNKSFPTKENVALNPENIYGMTKVFNEQLAEFYFKKFKINSVGLRFFTVYGKLGRPDMFIPKVITNIKTNKSIMLFNNGNHYRDFTYVEDVSKLILNIVKKISLAKKPKHNVYNVSYGSSVKIINLINQVSKFIGKKPKIIGKEFQLGDMYKTYGDNTKIKKIFKFKNLVDYKSGIKKILKKKL